MQQVNGKPLFVEREGEGPAVLFVHGLGGTTNFYEPQARALAGSHTVIRFDLAGAGRSPLAGTPSIESWADDAVAILDQFAIGTAAVVGHSMGTLIAARLAATRPERVSKLALLGALRAQPKPGQAVDTSAGGHRTGERHGGRGPRHRGSGHIRKDAA